VAVEDDVTVVVAVSHPNVTIGVLQPDPESAGVLLLDTFVAVTGTPVAIQCI